ncbi:hypothetical protein F0562_030628 [Nyssa sinensis]|uniref:Uncharacterized protein n=1 Tax=Nyssa sinensis TaxID=561372 RepID=A0A5J5AWY5_9ASTE|nr:hypothetical protein F0562_030628 [Nyssa sinensis]
MTLMRRASYKLISFVDELAIAQEIREGTWWKLKKVTEELAQWLSDSDLVVVDIRNGDSRTTIATKGGRPMKPDKRNAVYAAKKQQALKDWRRSGGHMEIRNGSDHFRWGGSGGGDVRFSSAKKRSKGDGTFRA